MRTNRASDRTAQLRLTLTSGSFSRLDRLCLCSCRAVAVTAAAIVVVVVVAIVAVVGLRGHDRRGGSRHHRAGLDSL